MVMLGEQPELDLGCSPPQQWMLGRTRRNDGRAAVVAAEICSTMMLQCYFYYLEGDEGRPSSGNNGK